MCPAISPLRARPVISGAVSYAFNAAYDMDFRGMINNRQDSTLEPAAKRLVIRLYDNVDLIFKTYSLKHPKASANLLICLRENREITFKKDGTPKNPWARRDKSSRYAHEFAQFLYATWLYEHSGTVDAWLKKRLAANDLHPKLRTKPGVADYRHRNVMLQTLEELDIIGAITLNHDSIEDLGLTKRRLHNSMLQASANDNGLEAFAIKETIDNLSKRPGEPEKGWMTRACRNELTLLCKLIDRTHNLATILDSGKKEHEINNYMNETETLLNRANRMICNNGTLTYMAQYLYDQIDLLRLYHDVKNEKKPLSELHEALTQLTRRYQPTYDNGLAVLIDEIHPMMCIVRRIRNDNALKSKLSIPRIELEAVPSDPQGVAPSHLTRSLGK